MRYILIFLLSFLTLNAQEDKQKLTIGLGAYIQTQPYENVDNILLPSPVIFYDDGLFYVRWSRAGMYFLGDKQDNYMWGVSITAQPRTYSFKASDSDTLTGMNERKTTWEGGLAFSATYNKAYIEIMALHDLMNRYDSWMIKTEIGYDIKLSDFSFYPSVIIGYQSDEFLNYYYGVSADEAISSAHNEYSAKAGFQIGVQTYIKYPLSESLSTLINLRADRLSQEATDSPIVTKDYIYSGLVSLIYTFEY